jgi:hypothetical protein
LPPHLVTLGGEAGIIVLHHYRSVLSFTHLNESITLLAKLPNLLDRAVDVVRCGGGGVEVSSVLNGCDNLL